MAWRIFHCTPYHYTPKLVQIANAPQNHNQPINGGWTMCMNSQEQNKSFNIIMQHWDFQQKWHGSKQSRQNTLQHGPCWHQKQWKILSQIWWKTKRTHATTKARHLINKRSRRRHIYTHCTLVTSQNQGCMCKIKNMKQKIYTNQTGQFPVVSSQGKRHVMVLCKIYENLILTEPIKSRALKKCAQYMNNSCKGFK